MEACGGSSREAIFVPGTVLFFFAVALHNEITQFVIFLRTRNRTLAAGHARRKREAPRLRGLRAASKLLLLQGKDEAESSSRFCRATSLIYRRLIADDHIWLIVFVGMCFFAAARANTRVCYHPPPPAGHP